jgi:predicted metal-binding protein
MKCMYGCSTYGKNASCPPNVPTVEECRSFFREYSDAVIFHQSGCVPEREARHRWTREVNLRLLDIERDVFVSGYPKAFLLFLDSCRICGDCRGRRSECNEPKSARPTPEGMGIDVFTTVKNIGYAIEVLSEYQQPMNRYAFLFIE